MSKPAFRIKSYKHPRLKFVVRSKLTGKWERKFFTSRAQAQTYVTQKETELLNQGKEGATFPSWLRVMAERENDRLNAFGKTLTDATDHYLKHLEATTRSVPLPTAMEELIANRRSSGATERYCYDLRMRLRRFCNAFPDLNVSEITTADIDAWLGGLNLGPVTRNTFRRDVRTLFSFALTRRYCLDNPVLATSKAKEIDSEIKIFSIGQTAKLLEEASVEMLPVFAIGAFAGLRQSEIKRLDWGQIDFDSGLIEVKAKHSKTAARRLVTMQPNLLAWLGPYRGRVGSVCPNNFRKRSAEDRDRAKLKEKWPTNGLRHSFGSYHLAHFKDAAALALQMGNSPDVIFRHYRELVKPKEAARYWQIKPSASASRKVVAFRSE
jgi:integrase